MKITIRPLGYLLAMLQDYMPISKQEAILSVQTDLTIRELIQQYQIDPAKIGLVLCNGSIVTFDYKLSEGDYIVLMPMLGGG